MARNKHQDDLTDDEKANNDWSNDIILWVHDTAFQSQESLKSKKVSLNSAKPYYRPL